MTTERYFHYSAAPLAEVRDADFDGAAHPEDKPNGLWFSVESGGGGGRTGAASTGCASPGATTESS